MTSNPSVSISKKALIHNFMQIKKLSGDYKIMCAVKGNAYGHGINTVASSFWKNILICMLLLGLVRQKH